MRAIPSAVASRYVLLVVVSLILFEANAWATLIADSAFPCAISRQLIYEESGSADLTCPVNLEQFDPSLGILKHVELRITLGPRHQIALNNPETSEQFVDFVADLTWGFELPASLSGTSVTSVSSLIRDGGIQPTDDLWQLVTPSVFPSPVSETFIFSGADVMPFVGSGSITITQVVLSSVSFVASNPSVHLMQGICFGCSSLDFHLNK